MSLGKSGKPEYIMLLLLTQFTVFIELLGYIMLLLLTQFTVFIELFG